MGALEDPGSHKGCPYVATHKRPTEIVSPEAGFNQHRDA